MVLQNNIFTLIRNDIPLRIKIADSLGIIESSVYRLAQRKSKKLTQYHIIEIILKHTGYKVEDIFKKENKTNA